MSKMKQRVLEYKKGRKGRGSTKRGLFCTQHRKRETGDLGLHEKAADRICFKVWQWDKKGMAWHGREEKTF